MERIFVTGATSMIGSALVSESLANGVEVYAMVRKNTPKLGRLPSSSRLHLVEGDLDTLGELPAKVPVRIDTFYHIAWGHTGAKRNESTELQADNIRTTLKAIRVAADGPETETNPVTPYGAAKLAAGLLGRMLARELGIAFIWPRIFSTYGIYDKPTSMISMSIRKMLDGEKTSFSPAEHRWDYLFSEDAGRAFYLMGEKGKDGAVYCIGSGESRRLRSFIEEMAEACGVPVTGIGDIPYPKDGKVRNLCADISNLTADTGFAPRVSFEEGIRRTVAWMRESQL